MGHGAGAHKTVETLDGMVYSFDNPEQSSTEQGRAQASRVVRSSVKCWIRLTRALQIFFKFPVMMEMRETMLKVPRDFNLKICIIFPELSSSGFHPGYAF